MRNAKVRIRGPSASSGTRIHVRGASHESIDDRPVNGPVELEPAAPRLRRVEKRTHIELTYKGQGTHSFSRRILISAFWGTPPGRPWDRSRGNAEPREHPHLQNHPDG